MPTFTTADGVEIAYELRGEGPPILVCHGGPSNICDTIIRELEPLAGSHTLVFHDYRGSGRSAAADPATYDFDQLADDADALRQHLGYPSVGVLAHSMGGFVALKLALRHQQRCERLALVATSPCGSPAPMALPVLKALGPARTLKALALGLRFLVLWSWRRPSAARTTAMYAPMSSTQEARRELRPTVDAAYPELPVDNDNASRLMKAIGDLDLRDQLGQVSCPVLILYGSRDAVMVAGGQMLTHGLRAQDTVVLPDVGHACFIEDPAATFGALHRFFATKT